MCGAFFYRAISRFSVTLFPPKSFIRTWMSFLRIEAKRKPKKSTNRKSPRDVQSTKHARAFERKARAQQVYSNESMNKLAESKAKKWERMLFFMWVSMFCVSFILSLNLYTTFRYLFLLVFFCVIQYANYCLRTHHINLDHILLLSLLFCFVFVTLLYT